MNTFYFEKKTVYEIFFSTKTGFIINVISTKNYIDEQILFQQKQDLRINCILIKTGFTN